MSADHFCPRHGRRSRPIEVPGLRCDCTSDRGRIYEAIDAERKRQQILHGSLSIASPLLPLDTKLRILVEEVGEVARAIDDLGKATERGQEKFEAARRHLRAELVEVATCAVGWLEDEDRESR